VNSHFCATITTNHHQNYFHHMKLKLYPLNTNSLHFTPFPTSQGKYHSTLCLDELHYASEGLHVSVITPYLSVWGWLASLSIMSCWFLQSPIQLDSSISLQTTTSLLILNSLNISILPLLLNLKIKISTLFKTNYRFSAIPTDDIFHRNKKES
jgi:hypothetical protein